MKKNAWTTLAAILLILYALTNFGAGMGEFSKAKMVSGTSSLAASMGKMAGDNARAQRVQRQGVSASAMLYLIAVFILATAVLELVGAVGLLSGQSWAVVLVTVAAICGLLVEIQDIAEDGFGVGKLIFLAINAVALFAAQSAKVPAEQRVTVE
jgi:uncharacterized membrane protein (DUF2068 family)